MPERFDLGGAAFHLVIDSTQFEPLLQQAEQQARAASQRIAAALSSAGRGAGGAAVAPRVDVAQATAALGQLRTQSTATQQAAAFTAAPKVDTRGATAQLADLQRAGRVTIAVKAEGAEETNASLGTIEQRARELRAASRVTLQVQAEGAAKAAEEIRSVQQSLARASAGNRVTIQVQTNAQQAEQTLARLQAEIKTAQARGVNIAINLDTRDAEARLGRFQQFAAAAGRGVVQGSGVGSGFLFGAGAGAGAIATLAVATAVSQLTQATVGGIRAGIAYNSQLEQIQNTLVHYTGSAAAAAAATEGFRKLATISPFTEQQVLGAGQNFIRVSGGDIQRAQELTALTVQLAAAHPERGFEEMQAAIQQLISGDFQAFEDRTNIAFGTVRRLAAQGATGMDLYRKAVEAAGGSPELLAKNASTFQARLSTFESNIQKFQAAATKGAFEALSGDIDAVNKSVERNAEGFGRLAGAIGGVTAQAVRATAALVTFGLSETAPRVAGFVAERLQGGAPSAGIGPSPVEQIAQQALTAQRDKAAEVQAQLKLNADAAAKVKSEYEQSIAPLQRQLDIINRPDFNLQRRVAQAQIGQGQAEVSAQVAQAPISTRVDVAGQHAVLQLEREGIEIRQRRAALAEQIGSAEQAVARRTAEIQIRAEEDGVRALQEGAQARQQARQDELVGLQETIRLRRQSVQDGLAGERELADATRQRFADAERASERANQAAQSALRSQIEALQEVNRLANQPRGPSAAEQALRQLDAHERARSAARTLAQAEAAVKNADTKPERQAARANLNEIKHQQEADRQRAALEAKITAEREAQEKARLAREEQIRQLEVKARDEDRAYQREKESRAEQERQRERTAVEQLRQEERAERARQREEDDQVRAIEKADREAARADQGQIAASLKTIASQRAGLQAGADVSGLANDQGNLDRLRELAANESKELDLRQQLLDGQDPFLAAVAARDKTLADNISALVGIQTQFDAASKSIASLPFAERLADAKLKLDQALAPLETRAAELEQRLRDVNAELVVQQAAVKQLKADQDLPRLQGIQVREPSIPPGGAGAPGTSPGITIPLNLGIPTAAEIDAGINGLLAAFSDRAGEASRALAAALTGGLSKGLAADEQTPKDITKWVDGSIIAPAFDALDAKSPSKIFEKLAGFAADGFVQGAQQWPQTIGPAEATAFQNATNQYVLPYFTSQFGSDVSAAFASAGAQLDSAAARTAFGAGMFAAIEGGYQSFVVPLFTAKDGIGAQLGTQFATAAAQLNNANVQRAIGVAAHDALTLGLNQAVRDQSQWWKQFETVGENLAISIANGMQRYFNTNPLPIPQTQPTRPAQPFGHNAAGGYIPPRGWSWVGEQGPELVRAGPAGLRVVSHQESVAASTSPADPHITRMARGGWIEEPTWLVSQRTGRVYAEAGEAGREAVVPARAGQIIPAAPPASLNGPTGVPGERRPAGLPESVTLMAAQAGDPIRMRGTAQRAQLPTPLEYLTEYTPAVRERAQRDDLRAVTLRAGGFIAPVLPAAARSDFPDVLHHQRLAFSGRTDVREIRNERQTTAYPTTFGRQILPGEPVVAVAESVHLWPQIGANHAGFGDGIGRTGGLHLEGDRAKAVHAENIAALIAPSFAAAPAVFAAPTGSIGQLGANVGAASSQSISQASFAGGADNADDRPSRAQVAGFPDIEAVLAGVHDAALQASLGLIAPNTPRSRFWGLAAGDYAAANFLVDQPAPDPLPAGSGLVEAGNIDLYHRPVVRNADGSISTVRSISIEQDGLEVLIPTVSPDGRTLSNRQAIGLYERTDQHLGKFNNGEAAEAYAQALHEWQARFYLTPPPNRNEIVVNPLRVLSDVADELGGQANASQLASSVAGTGLRGVLSHEVAHNAVREHNRAHELLTQAIQGQLGGIGADLEEPFRRFAEQFPVQIPGHAAGGAIKPYDWSWVGEQGPELVRAGGSGASVLSARDSLAALKSDRRSGGLTIGNLTVTVPPGTSDPAGFARQIVRTVFTMIDQAERQSPDAAPPTLGGAM